MTVEIMEIAEAIYKKYWPGCRDLRERPFEERVRGLEELRGTTDEPALLELIESEIVAAFAEGGLRNEANEAVLRMLALPTPSGGELSVEAADALFRNGMDGPAIDALLERATRLAHAADFLASASARMRRILALKILVKCSRGQDVREDQSLLRAYREWHPSRASSIKEALQCRPKRD